MTTRFRLAAALAALMAQTTAAAAQIKPAADLAGGAGYTAMMGFRGLVECRPQTAWSADGRRLSLTRDGRTLAFDTASGAETALDAPFATPEHAPPRLYKREMFITSEVTRLKNR